MSDKPFSRDEADAMEATLVEAYDVLEREVMAAFEKTLPVFEQVAVALRAALPDVDANKMPELVAAIRNAEAYESESYHYRLNDIKRLVLAQRSAAAYSVGRLRDMGLVEGAKPDSTRSTDRRLFGLKAPLGWLTYLRSLKKKGA